MSGFEAQCDCELDSPGTLSHLPVEERLDHWKDWALYLKGRIETHYRPELARRDAAMAEVGSYVRSRRNYSRARGYVAVDFGTFMDSSAVLAVLGQELHGDEDPDVGAEDQHTDLCAKVTQLEAQLDACLRVLWPAQRQQVAEAFGGIPPANPGAQA